MKKSFYISFLVLLSSLSCSYLPESELVKSPGVNYRETTEYIELSPTGPASGEALLFIPGGLVDAHAYVSVLNPVVLQGIQVVILKVTANLSILENGKALKIKEKVSGFDSWYLSGHSLGGISALSVVKNNPQAFQGLILMGTYPSEGFAIQDWERNVLSIYAENDQLSTIQEIEENKIFLPAGTEIDSLAEIDSLPGSNPQTIYFMIKGGNHAQFGDYGTQNGDGPSTISSQNQHDQIKAAIIKFIQWNESF